LFQIESIGDAIRRRCMTHAMRNAGRHIWGLFNNIQVHAKWPFAVRRVTFRSSFLHLSTLPRTILALLSQHLGEPAA